MRGPGKRLRFGQANTEQREDAGGPVGSSFEFGLPGRVPPRARFGLATTLVERDGPRGRRAVLHIGDLATVCVVADIPSVGDAIHDHATEAVVEKVRVTRDGHVYIHARPLAPAS